MPLRDHPASDRRHLATATRGAVARTLVTLVVCAVLAPHGGAWAAPLNRTPDSLPLQRPSRRPPTATVGVHSYYDVDADGVRDADERPLDGYAFRLFDVDGRLVRGGITRDGRVVFGRLTPAPHRFVQLHPDESGAWFNTTGNPRFTIELGPYKRVPVVVGTAHSLDGALLPHSDFVQFPELISAQAVASLNQLPPFEDRPFVDSAQVVAFLGGGDGVGGDGRERLARELALFVVGFDRLAGSTRCAIAHQGRWKEAALLAREAGDVWRDGSDAEITEMLAALSTHTTGAVAYVPLQPPPVIY